LWLDPLTKTTFSNGRRYGCHAPSDTPFPCAAREQHQAHITPTAIATTCVTPNPSLFRDDFCAQVHVSAFAFASMTAFSGMHHLWPAANSTPSHLGILDLSVHSLVPQIISGPDDTPYEGGLYTATLSFPKTYPNAPPKMQFTCDMYHPNIYPDGTVCECHRLRAYVRVCASGWLVRRLVGCVGSCILLR
jgi:hypothetical protein